MFENLPNTFKRFHDSVQALKLNRHFDNFDAHRFNYDGQDHSKEFNTGLHAFYFDWFFKNSISLFTAYSLLNNEFSKRLFLHLIAYRLGGHLSVKIPVAFAGKEIELVEYKACEKHTPSQLPATGDVWQIKSLRF